MTWYIKIASPDFSKVMDDESYSYSQKIKALFQLLEKLKDLSSKDKEHLKMDHLSAPSFYIDELNKSINELLINLSGDDRIAAEEDRNVLHDEYGYNSPEEVLENDMTEFYDTMDHVRAWVDPEMYRPSEIPKDYNIISLDIDKL